MSASHQKIYEKMKQYDVIGRLPENLPDECFLYAREIIFAINDGLTQFQEIYCRVYERIISNGMEGSYFPLVIQWLKEKNYIIKENEVFSLTDKGKNYIEKFQGSASVITF